LNTAFEEPKNPPFYLLKIPPLIGFTKPFPSFPKLKTVIKPFWLKETANGSV